MKLILLHIVFFYFSFLSFAQNLIINGGAETSPLALGWTATSIGSSCFFGSNWGITGGQSGFPAAQSGSRYFFSGCGFVSGQLYQDISVAGSAAIIDAGAMRYEFFGYTRSYDQTPMDGARIRVQFRDVSSTILSTYDTGMTYNRNAWQMYTDNRIAPVGTRTIRIILSSESNNGTSVDGYFDNLSLTAIIALPIVLTDFSAHIIDQNNVQLNWSTASEVNNDYFTIEKSTEGSTWTRILQVSGAGNSFNEKTYTEFDQSREIGTYYYRLKQTDFDGKYTYSKVISVVSDVNSIHIYPIPANNFITINGETEELSTIKIFDLAGKMISDRISILNFSGNTLILDISNLDNGSYIVQTKTSQTRIVKNE